MAKGLANESVKYAALPLVSVLDKKSMKTATALLEELDSVDAARVSYEERQKEILEELREIQERNNLPGLRYGGLCFVARTMPGRRTLDKMLLVENGVSPEVIEASTKQGESYVTKTFRRIDA